MTTAKLHALDGQARGPATTGEDVMNALGDVLADLLPGVPLNDPHRPALAALALAAGRQDAVSSVRAVR
jgi:hypothetical protein